MRRFLVLVGLVFAIGACGGSGGGAANGPAGDPVGAVNGFINTIKAKAFDKLPALVCAAKKDEILGPFAGGGSPGPQQALMNALSFDFQNGNVQQKSVSGDNAVVHVTGKLVTTVDANKAKDAVKQFLGDQATDDQINQFVTSMNSSRDIDEDIDVVKENGGWVVCSALTSST
jgi:hypothetical protein